MGELISLFLICSDENEERRPNYSTFSYYYWREYFIPSFLQETFYLYPQQAFNRHQKVIDYAARAVAGSICSINAANESEIASDVNTLAVSSPSFILRHSTASILFEGERCCVPLSSYNSTDSSSNGISCSSNVGSDHPQLNKEHDSSVANGHVSSEISSDHQFLGLLSHPGRQPWRRTKLLVPSQIDGGLASMQNITFTESKDPFCKTR